MNRGQRRAAKALARRTTTRDPAQVVAVHEAGHAIAKVLTCGELQYDLTEIIYHIKTGLGDTWTPTIDGKGVSCSKGETFGPTFSREMLGASREFLENKLEGRRIDGHLFKGSDAQETYSRIIELSRAAGADIKQWFRARVFGLVSGSTAEAIFSRLAFDEVWEYQSEGDLLRIYADAVVSGITIEEMYSVIDRMAALSAYLMELPPMWAAVLELARQLPTLSQMEGNEAEAVIASVLSGSDLTGMFAGGIKRLAELETEINAADVAVAIIADESIKLIKGKRVVEMAIKDRKDLDVQVTQRCASPVFAEMLWRAFGDGAGWPSEGRDT